SVPGRCGISDENVYADRTITPCGSLLPCRCLNVPTPLFLLEARRMFGGETPLIDLDQRMDPIANRLDAVERALVLDRAGDVAVMYYKRCLARNPAQRAVPGEVAGAPDVLVTLGQHQCGGVRDRHPHSVAAQRSDIDVHQIQGLRRGTLPQSLDHLRLGGRSVEQLVRGDWRD